MAAALLVTSGLGCDDPAPPPRAAYLAVWSDALESVIREQALAGGSDRLSNPRPEDRASLAAAVDAARTSHGLDQLAWERAVLAHEREAREEIHVRTSDLVHGWAQVARNPVGTLGRVVSETTEAALSSGWAPDKALYEAAVTASFRVAYVPDLEDPRPAGLRQVAGTRLPLDTEADLQALSADLTAFRETTSAFMEQVLAALPPTRLRQTLSDQRLTDGMWEYAQQRWHAGPPPPPEGVQTPIGDQYSVLTAMDEWVAELEEAARLIDAWWAAGIEDAGSQFVARVRTEARSILADQVEAAAAGTGEPPGGGAEVPAQVLAESRARLAAQARADVPLRMLLLRRQGDDAGPAADAVAAELAAARAVAGVPAQRVIDALTEHARSVPLPDVEDFLVRWELANLAMAAARATLQQAAGVEDEFLDYVDRRLDAQRGAKEALDAEIALRLGDE